MSTIALEQLMSGPVVQGKSLVALPLPQPESKLSLLIKVPGVHYALEAPIFDNPIIEDHKITARFIVDDNVYFDLTLVGQGSKQENQFKVGQFSLFYRIEERRPRAHFVADTLMAAMGLAGRLDLIISEPEVSTNLTVETSLLETSKMLHRRQTAYRLMVIEEATGKQFLFPPSISGNEIKAISFVYHAIVDRSFIWSSGSTDLSIPATQENASLFTQLIQPFSLPLPEQFISETVLGQPIDLGRAIVTIEDAIVKNLDEIRKQLEARDNRQVTFEIRSLSGQVKYEFVEIPYSPNLIWEPKIQALIALEPYLDLAISDRYHALAASTLEGLTEEEKIAITARPELDEQAF